MPERESAAGSHVAWAKGAGPLIRERSVKISRAEVDIDRTKLTLRFIGGAPGDVLTQLGAAEYEAEVDENADPSSVTIWKLAPTKPPTPIDPPEGVRFGVRKKGHQREVVHVLEGAPPQEILDGAQSEVIPVFQLTVELAPSALPDPWKVDNLGPPGAPPPWTSHHRLSNGSHVLFVRSLLVARPEDALDPFLSGTANEHLQIRRGKAILESADQTQTLRFVEGSFLYELQSGQAMPIDELVELANSLR